VSTQSFRVPEVACNVADYLQASCVEDALFTFSAAITCSEDGVLGPRDGEIWRYVAVDLPVDGTYAFRLRSSTPSDGDRVDVKGCASGCGSGSLRLEVDPPELVEFIELPAGRYTLRLTRPEDQPGEIDVWIDRANADSACG
jgi:hypothetical protein